MALRARIGGIVALLLGGALAGVAVRALRHAEAREPFVTWSTKAAFLGPAFVVMGVAFLLAPSSLLEQMSDDDGSLRLTVPAALFLGAVFVTGLIGGGAMWVFLQARLTELGYVGL